MKLLEDQNGGRLPGYSLNAHRMHVGETLGGAAGQEGGAREGEEEEEEGEVLLTAYNK